MKIRHGQGNRGMAFEHLLNIVNKQYDNKGIAIINKRPTPVKVLRSKGTRVLSGFYEGKSTVDYDGIYQGRAIAFEAKSVGERRFDLKNVQAHQLAYLEKVAKNGAIAFFLVEIRPEQRVYYVPLQMMQGYVKRAQDGGRKSIPLDELEVYATEVTKGRGVPLDYLAVVDKLHLERVMSG